MKNDGKVKLVCNECGKSKRVSPNAADPRCSCGSVDWEVADDGPIANRETQHSRYLDCGPSAWDDR